MSDKVEGNITDIVEELCQIMQKYGNSLATQMAQTVRKATERPDLLAKAARNAWAYCMKNPESISRISKAEKQRANDIMDYLDEKEKQ